MRGPEGLIAEAVELGHLSLCDPAQLAFEVEALLVAGNHVYHLDNDPRALALARAGIARRLEDLRTPEAPALADDPPARPDRPLTRYQRLGSSLASW
jgi:hypothetical protein